MAGLFGALWLLLYGTAHAHKNITESIDNNKSREEARKVGRKYYHAIDGERAVDTNHRVLRLPDGIKDAHTGQWLYDKKKEDAKERAKISELDEISKREAIIKGKPTYQCTFHDSDPRKNNLCMTCRTWYKRLVCNDMPVDRIKGTFFQEWDEGHKNFEFKHYDEIHELQFGFHIPYNVELGLEEKVYKYAKNWNMNYIMKSICEVYPINKVKVIYNYCKKYEIPLGDWNEIEAMMLEEHPLGWRKVPPCEDWQYEKFLNSFIK